MKYPTLTFYTSSTCGLCKEVKLELQRLHLRYPHRLQKIDIEADRALFAQYFDKIPVVQAGDEEISAPITAVQLENLLKKATNSSNRI